MLRPDHARAELGEVERLAQLARSGDPILESDSLHARHRLGRALLDANPPGTFDTPSLDGALDPFPAVRGRPPEITLAELDLTTLRGALAWHGCLLVHGFFPDPTMQVLRADIDEMAAGFDRWMASGLVESTPSRFEPFEAPGAVLPIGLRNMCGPMGTFYAADTPRGFLHLMDAFDAAGVRELLLDYMQQPVLLGLEKTALRRVPNTIPTAWHQDGIAFGRDVGLVNIWVALSPCGRDAPGLAVLPKRLTEILPLDADSNVPWEIRPDAIAAARGDIEPVELVLEPGDAIVFDEMLLHSTVVREQMTKPRYCADAWFFPVSAFPSDLYKPLAYAVP